MVHRTITRLIIGGLIFGILSFRCPAQEMDTKILNFSVNVEPHISLKVLRGTDRDSVRIKISTNMVRPYQVFVVPFGPLTDQRGKVLSSKYLKFSIVGTEKGRSEVPIPTPISLNEQLIYTSNLNGDPDTFDVVFYFQAEEKVPVGTYTLNLTYRIQVQ